MYLAKLARATSSGDEDVYASYSQITLWHRARWINESLRLYRSLYEFLLLLSLSRIVFF